MIFKGGYQYYLDPIIITHDVISIVLRLLLTCYILEVKNRIPLKIIFIGSIFFMIKFNVFAHPLILDYDKYRSIQKAKVIRSQMVGTWNGVVLHSTYEDYKDKREQFSTKIIIDSSFIFFEKIPHLQPQYSFVRCYSNYGHLAPSNDSGEREFNIEKITTDSLVFKIFEIGTDYLFKLKRKND